MKKIIKKSHSNEPVVRFVALGGLEEIGRNMMFFEYENEIIVIDAGLQFPEEETPGIDYIIPNTQYLEKKKANIKALIITHGHMDHIGAIPHILDKLGNPTIYTTRLTKEVVLKRLEDFPHTPKPHFDLINGGETRQISKNFAITFFDVVHNIPDGVGMIIRTPMGNIVHPGEFKFDYDKEGKPKGLEVWKQVGAEGVHTLLLDSTGAEVPGFAMSERVVEAELEKIFKGAKGRIIVGTFASLLDRLIEIIKIAEKLGKHVATSGYSMKTNLEIAKRLGYLKTERGTMISLDEMHKYPDNKVMILSTGAQGESNASLMRMANGEHKQVQIKKGDTIVLSSSIIPGNERSIQNLKDNLCRQGAIIFHYKMLDIHSSGHAPQEELKAVMKLVNPKHFLPIHGYYFLRSQNAKLAQEAIGLSPEATLIADNGVVVEFTKNEARMSGEQVVAYPVMVDGLGVGDVSDIVLRDRRSLAAEGMIVIIATVDRKTGKTLKNPDIISRGFIYLKENQEFLNEIRRKIRSIVGRIPQGHPIDGDYLRAMIKEQIGQFLYTKTKRRPMILPVVIEI